ncbi:hypothetical protein CEXT_91091 [Caerostris extrusa]|uniref:Uncharacterized protein n=1 Tax=Caerostris extrusa TaxID=172846 RepID=A0AAV4PQQ1_CAEEX|nr:hypothetical protein CEXT_91091 [Caerostris extrusa]
MCEHDKLHIRNSTVDWISAYYVTLDIHHHYLSVNLCGKIPWIGPTLQSWFVVDRPYEVFFPRGLEHIEASDDYHTGHMFLHCALKTVHQCSSELSFYIKQGYFSKSCSKSHQLFCKILIRSRYPYQY